MANRCRVKVEQPDQYLANDARDDEAKPIARLAYIGFAKKCKPEHSY